MNEREFLETVLATSETQKVAELLHVRGYRQTSRKFGIIARVDISDDKLRQIIAKERFLRPEDVRIDESEYNHYRRCISKDSYEGVSEAVLKHLREM